MLAFRSVSFVSWLVCLCLASAWEQATDSHISSGDELEDYLKKRAEFLKQEDALSDGSGTKLTEDELHFDGWLRATVQGIINEYKKERLVDRFVPATYFPRVRAHIENTTLYKVLRQMPKGGALHLHFASASSLEWVVNQGLDLPGCYVFWPNTTSVAADDFPLGSLAFFNSTQEKQQGFFPAHVLIHKVQNFRERLLKLLMVQEEDEKLTSAEIWKKFADVFVRLAGFFTHRKAVEGYFVATAQEFLADAVTHLEFRVDLFHDEGFLSDLDGREYRGAAVMDVFQKQIDLLQLKFPDLTVKLIGSSVRFRNTTEIWKDLEFALEVKSQRPDILVGWDAPGEEDAGRPTLDYARQLLDMKNLSKSKGIELPLMLHDGESDWSTMNTVDAVLLGAKRLGHGFNIVRHPLLMEEVKKRGVAIEVCPISNQVLRYVTDLRIHPGAEMLKNGLPVVISSDDPGIWSAKGLSHDFWEATVAWQLNTRDLKTLAKNSIEYSGLAATEKQKVMARWEQSWKEFMARWRHEHLEFRRPYTFDMEYGVLVNLV